jgi:ketosteroid isomerase-like protein
MHAILLLTFGLLPAASPDAFSVQADVQGLYDEISQASLQFLSEADVDDFHDVIYTPDWTVVDSAGTQRTWAQLRAEVVQTLKTAHHDPMVQSIQKMTLSPGGATALVNVTIVRTVTDDEGRYGRKGASHTLTETTPFRDTWVTVGDRWKMKARQQVGPAKVVVDKPEFEP